MESIEVAFRNVSDPLRRIVLFAVLPFVYRAIYVSEAVLGRIQTARSTRRPCLPKLRWLWA